MFASCKGYSSDNKRRLKYGISVSHNQLLHIR
jgi:hypothetical protein